MTNPSKREHRSWRIAAVALAVALGAGAAQLAQAMPGGHGGGMRGHAEFCEGPMGARFGDRALMGGHLLQGLGTTAEQQARLRDIMKAAREDIRKQREAAGNPRAEMMRLLAAPNVDAAAAEAQRQKIAAQHEAASKRMLQAMLDASAVLTVEQRQKLAERSDRMAKRREMMERHRRERQSLEQPRSP